MFFEIVYNFGHFAIVGGILDGINLSGLVFDGVGLLSVGKERGFGQVKLV